MKGWFGSVYASHSDNKRLGLLVTCHSRLITSSMDIQQFTIHGSDEVVYIPEFVTEEEEIYLLRKAGRLFLYYSSDLDRFPDRGDPRTSVEDASE